MLPLELQPSGWLRGATSRCFLGEGNMDEGVFQRKLGELVAEIGTLPVDQREKLTLLAEETKQRHQELKKTVTSLQERDRKSVV